MPSIFTFISREDRFERAVPPFTVVAAVLMALLAVSCLSTSQTEAGRRLVQVFERGWTAEVWQLQVAGHWSLSFERSAFVPCDGTGRLTVSDWSPGEEWWAVPEGHATQNWTRRVWRGQVPWADTTVFVVWRGDLSARRASGHLGAYARELAVTELVQLRAAAPGDCHWDPVR